MAKQKKKRKRKKRKKDTTQTQELPHVLQTKITVLSLTNTHATLRIGNQSVVVPRTSMRGKFHTLIRLMEQKGFEYLFDETEKVINIKINNVYYIYSQNIPQYIFMYNELHEYIQGYIELDENTNYQILADIFKSAYEIYKLNQKEVL